MPSVKYLIAHFGVVEDVSLTTALHMVFDGSSHTSSGKFSNDKQIDGPALQNDLFRNLIRFRNPDILRQMTSRKFIAKFWLTNRRYVYSK